MDKGVETSKYILDEGVKHTYLGMVYQESAYYDIDDDDYIKAEIHVTLADGHFNKLPEGANKNYFLATNRELSGRIYLKLEKYDDAYGNYNEAIVLLEDIAERDASLNGFIYSGLGQVYFAGKDYENAHEQLIEAEKIAESADFLNLKLEVYKTLSEYYKATGDYAAYSVYNEKFIEAYRLNEANKSKSVRSFIDSIEMRNQFLLKNRNIVIAASSLLILFFAGAAIIYRNKRKMEFERFKSTIAYLKQKDNLPAIEKTADASKKNGGKQIMSADIEERIVNDLQKFEKDNKFTDKDMSLSVLAGLLKTNTKYLSRVLKMHKNKDFNHYINDLRIKYIIDKIEADKEYKRYKISYLAEECGFSSHSKFTAVFKSVTGFTPSDFIKYHEKLNENNNIS